MYVEKTNFQSKSDLIFQEYQTLAKNLNSVNIGLNYRPGAENIWKDSFIGRERPNLDPLFESQFTEWCIDQTWYTRQQLEELQEHFKIKCGRTRFLCLQPMSGLPVHKDLEVRYHLAIKTNIHSYFGFTCTVTKPSLANIPNASVCYHIPKDNTWYLIDTTQDHYIYNLGKEPRIHLLVCQA